MTLSRLSLFILCILAAQVGRTAETADDLFARALQLTETDLTAARELHRAAALNYIAEAEARPAQRGPLLYNAGNSFHLAGDAGRSIVAYRRAESELPGSPLLKANLAYVRKQSGNPDDLVLPGRWEALRFWCWSSPVQWLVLAAALTIFWAELFRWQWTAKHAPLTIRYGSLTLAVLMGATLAGSHVQETRRCRGVLVSSHVTALKGPSYGYAQAFTTPLDAGIECDVLRRKSDWLLVRVSEERTAWVPAATVEIWKGAPRSH